MFLGQGNHLLEAIRKNPVIGKNYFEILACRRQLPKSMVVVWDDSQKSVVLKNADAGVFFSIPACDCDRIISAAIVDDGVVPILISLGKDAFDAFREKLGPIVNGSNDAD